MYSIGEISKMFDLPISTLRYYDKEGLFPHLKRVNGVRQFSENEIETLRIIDCLKRSGLEIKDIKEYMNLCSLGNSTLKQRKEIFVKQKEEVLQEMEKLQKVLSMLNYKCWYYDQAIEKEDEGYVQALSFEQLHHKFNNTINIVMRIVRDEKENINDTIHHFNSLCGLFWHLCQ